MRVTTTCRDPSVRMPVPGDDRRDTSRAGNSELTTPNDGIPRRDWQYPVLTHVEPCPSPFGIPEQFRPCWSASRPGTSPPEAGAPRELHPKSAPPLPARPKESWCGRLHARSTCGSQACQPSRESLLTPELRHGNVLADELGVGGRRTGGHQDVEHRPATGRPRLPVGGISGVIYNGEQNVVESHLVLKKAIAPPRSLHVRGIPTPCRSAGDHRIWHREPSPAPNYRSASEARSREVDPQPRPKSAIRRTSIEPPNWPGRDISALTTSASRTGDGALLRSRLATRDQRRPVDFAGRARCSVGVGKDLVQSRGCVHARSVE